MYAIRIHFPNGFILVPRGTSWEEINKRVSRITTTGTPEIINKWGVGMNQQSFSREEDLFVIIRDQPLVVQLTLVVIVTRNMIGYVLIDTTGINSYRRFFRILDPLIPDGEPFVFRHIDGRPVDTGIPFLEERTELFHTTVPGVFVADASMPDNMENARSPR
jgi:hypothetical protein